MSENLVEKTVFDRLIPELKAEGYEVVREPNSQQLPTFLKKYQPDLIALRSDKKIAFEFKQSTKPHGHELEYISKLFEGQSDWEFRVIWLSSSDSSNVLRRQSKQKIFEFYQQCINLNAEENYSASFLLAWATLEAAARRVIGDNLAKPQTPGRVVEQLASLGYLTPNEADSLRTLALLRNKIVHGELDTMLDKSTVNRMLTHLGVVVSLIGKNSAKVA